jgi:hypothetical protein
VKKPDRWTRIVQRFADRPMDDSREITLTDREAIALLRREHAWVVRTAKALLPTHPNASEFWDGYDTACVDMLEKLKERAQ